MTQNTDALASQQVEEPTWKQRAVERSTRAAKLRAEQRVQRFLDAAQVIITEKGSTDFTVQEVVDRSRQSLRSFYQHFDGKHELLLALFEETVRTTTEVLRQKVEKEDDPVDRLHCFVVEYYRLCRPAVKGKAKKGTAGPPVMVDFAQQLLTGHPTEAATAFAPVVSLFTEVLDGATAAGALRPGLRQGPIAGMVLEAIMFNTFSATIGGISTRPKDMDPAEELWDLIMHGIGA